MEIGGEGSSAPGSQTSNQGGKSFASGSRQGNTGGGGGRGNGQGAGGGGAKPGPSKPPGGPPRRPGQGPTLVEHIAPGDALARHAITNALVGLLRERTTTTPMAIGLFGAWGSGKSSQLNFLRRELNKPVAGKPEIRIVEFNAWEHEKCDNLSAALAQTVVDELIRDTSLADQWRLARQLAACKRRHMSTAIRRDWASLSATLHEWLGPFMSLQFAVPVIIALLLVMLPQTQVPDFAKAIASAGVLGVGVWKTVNDYVRANLSNWFQRIASGAGGGPFGLPDFADKLGSFHTIRKTLQDLVSLRVDEGTGPSTGQYLLIVVDDLDRCSVGTIKLVLDAVRLVTNIPRVVTLVAVDDRIAFPAVESFFEQFKGSGRDPSEVARDYLAKVFNASITLPPVSESLAKAFITGHLFANRRIEAFDAVPASTALGEIDQSESVTDEEVNAFRDLAIWIGMTNPRALWRMKRAWYLLRTMALSFGEAEDSVDAWMRSMFVREAILSLPAALRCEIDRWARAVRDGHDPGEPPVAVGTGLGALLEEDADGIAKRWAYADVVLLPAAASGKPQPAPGLV